MNGPGQHVVYEFGDFRLDASRRLLFANGAPSPISIKPKVFETLLYFLERPGELLEKDRLMADLWPGLVVEEGNLTQTIHTLRRALGERPDEHRFIVTVPGRGYRFVADVVRESHPPETHREAPAVTPAAQTGNGRSRRPALIALVTLAGVLGAALLAYGWYAHWSPAREKPATTPASSPVATELPARTVAILPFENLSADEGNEHLASGVAESVLHRLASVRGLTLIARTSSSAFRDKPADAREIGRALNARYLVEGSVQRSGDRLRVTAQLIDASTGGHLWSLRFDRTIDDIFAVEDEISQNVARALEVSLAEDEHPYARYGTEAYLAVLQGRALVASRKVADAERAIERFSNAIEIAPAFAAAYVELANAHIHLIALLNLPDSSDIVIAANRKAESLLSKALTLDDRLGEAYVLRANIKDFKGDKAGAEADFRKGLALNPNYGRGHEQFASFLDNEGRIDEALAALDRARLVDPLYPRSHYYKGMLLLLHRPGTLEEAEGLFLQALSVAPDFHPALQRLGTIRELEGRLAEAVSYSERAIGIDPRASWLRVELSQLYLDLNDPGAARHVIAELRDAPPEAWVPVCLYENDLEGAHSILSEVGMNELPHLNQLHPFVLRAVRDRALVSGEPGGAREVMQAVAEKWDPTLSAADPESLSRAIAAHGLFYPDEVLTAAQWRKSIGERTSAERSARAALEWIEEQRQRGRRKYSFDRKRAVALAILGQKDAAMAALDHGFTSGDLYHWWYDIDREPAFAAFRKDPRFQALATKARAQVSAQRKLLEVMRRDGTVPKRVLPASSAPAC